MEKIVKRDAVTGDKLLPALKTNTQIAEVPANYTPDQPLPDMRVEEFLMDIVENSVTGTQNLYRRYCTKGFATDIPQTIIKNNMRKLLNTPVVKERLKYLRASEWELNRPDISQLSKKFEELIDDTDLKPNDKINALNSLAKLVGLFTPEQTETGPKVAVIFNSLEKPPQVAIKAK